MFFFLLFYSAVQEELWSDGGNVGRVEEAVIQSASLTSCMALQGYGDDLAGQMNEVNLADLFLHTPQLPHLQEHLLSLFTDTWSLFNHLTRGLIQTHLALKKELRSRKYDSDALNLET